ncbi:hypothetical protein NHJ13734_008725, partial [Beauveria thailandica]
ESARMIHRPHSSSSSSSSSSRRDDGDSIDRHGYQRAAKMTMTWDEKDASGYWAKHEHETGACCSRRGGCVFSDRGGCCFSDREACCVLLLRGRRVLLQRDEGQGEEEQEVEAGAVDGDSR